MRRRACLVLGLAAVVALPAQASANVTVDDFKVEPASKQAGGHPNVTITQTFSYGSDADDSVRDAFVRLPPGLLGNPQNAGFCSQQQFSSDTCPPNSTVGSVQVTARLTATPLITLTNPGTVFNLTPTGNEPARVGVLVEAAGGLSKIRLQAPVFVKPGPDGYGLESTFADQPRNSGGLGIQITKVALTFNGQASKGPFMRMPTSCATGTAVTRANSWDASNVFSQRTTTVTPTGCDKLAFNPKAEGSMGTPGQTGPGDFPPVSTTLRFNPEEAALRRAEVVLPNSLAPNPPGTQRSCPRPLADSGNCPDSSRVGTAIIDSPLQAKPVRGPVYFALNTDNPIPGLLVILPPPVGVRLDGLTELGAFGTKNTFAANPDLPVRSFTLEFEGVRQDALLTLNQDLCAPNTDRTMELRLVAYNGKESSFSQELATPGCDPRARVSIRRRGRKATLVARLKAGRDGPGITGFRLKLPRTLARGRARPYVVADGTRMRARSRRRQASRTFSADVRSATVVWRGLRAGPRLRRTTTVRLSMLDARPHTTALKQSVRVRGKPPKRH
ncbi:MAG TPA: hypothetical protein VGO83_14645 [Thermoleophilaceae bacterium]|nr:hypothetical protein [Thermoleophilaceae bacterium]